jgi:hypothetical protein
MKLKSTIVIALLVVLCCVGIYTILGQRVTLVADEDIFVLDSPSINPLHSNPVYTLKSGEKMSVSACIDLKHYIVPEIILADGRKGYVVKGKFHLDSGPFWQSGKGPLVYSCRAVTGQ